MMASLSNWEEDDDMTTGELFAEYLNEVDKVVEAITQQEIDDALAKLLNQTDLSVKFYDGREKEN